eukprot:6532393-Karenia_brevis.AAC.1
MQYAMQYCLGSPPVIPVHRWSHWGLSHHNIQRCNRRHLDIGGLLWSSGRVGHWSGSPRCHLCRLGLHPIHGAHQAF